MNRVFLLSHVRSDDEYAEDSKLIGVYSSEEEAQRAIARVVDRAGFKDQPAGFQLDPYTLGEDHWTEGFISWNEACPLPLEEVAASHGAYFFEGTTYWSQGDEDAHFAWMKAIACIRSVQGAGRRVYLDIDDKRVSEEDLRELHALYRRYDGDHAQLARLAATAQQAPAAALEGSVR